jgi:hypothetical protein
MLDRKHIFFAESYFIDKKKLKSMNFFNFIQMVKSAKNREGKYQENYDTKMNACKFKMKRRSN